MPYDAGGRFVPNDYQAVAPVETVEIVCSKCDRPYMAPASKRDARCPHCREQVRHYRCTRCDGIVQFKFWEIRQGHSVCPLCGKKVAPANLRRATTSDYAEALQREGLLGGGDDAVRLRGCTLLGGYGLDIETGARCGIVFGTDMVRVTPSEPRLEIPYDKITAIDVSGKGLVQQGGGIWGGGFGAGAIVGMGVAAVLNDLTTKRHIDTVVAVKTNEFGIVVGYPRETPEALRIRLAGPMARVEAAQSYTPKLWMRLRRKAAYLPG